ncbi:hypothetical protein [Shimia sp.]|uniref:hypothetical protein n=1 Tax=Shimia sp. TaxID=1954381 RepID=UPI00329A5E5C
MSYTTSLGRLFPTTADGTSGSTFDVTGLSNGNWATVAWHLSQVDGRVYSSDGSVRAEFTVVEPGMALSQPKYTSAGVTLFRLSW